MSKYKPVFSKKFHKSLKKLLKSGSFDVEKLESIVDMLSNDKPLPENLRDHILKANWEGYRECHVEPNLLLIYKIEDEELFLTNIGSHSELFG